MVSVAGMLPRRQRQAIARVSVSALLASLPLLYVSLRKPPPAALSGDTAFWFLMSNCVIAAIVATADDAGTLFFGSSSKEDDDPFGVDHVLVPGGGQQPVAGPEGSGGDAVVPLPVVSAANDEPTVVSLKGGGRVQEEVVASTVTATSSNSMDLRLNHTNIPVLQQGEEDEVAIGEPSTDTHNSTTTVMTAKGQGVEGEIARPTTPASDEAAAAIPVGKLGIITKAAHKASLLAEPDPWAPKLVTSKSLPEEEAATEEDWPVALYSSRPPDVLVVQDKNRDGRLRRWATEGSTSRQAAEDRDSSEYWELSDEELNRRVENFIARFNREMRRQIEQEAGSELATTL